MSYVGTQLNADVLRSFRVESAKEGKSMSLKLRELTETYLSRKPANNTGGMRMSAEPESVGMSRKDMVFRSLERLRGWIAEQKDLNASKDQLLASIERISSWEPPTKKACRGKRKVIQPDEKGG
jgi:hypothetical protein